MSIRIYDRAHPIRPENRVLIEMYDCPECQDWIQVDLNCLSCHASQFSHRVILTCPRCQHDSTVNHPAIKSHYATIRKYHGFYHYYPASNGNSGS